MRLASFRPGCLWFFAAFVISWCVALAPATVAELTVAAVPIDQNVRQRSQTHLNTLGLQRNTECFLRTVASAHLPLVRLLLSAGINVNAHEAGRSALLVAAAMGNAELVKELLDAGADVRLADARGRTPLMFAAMHGNERMFLECINRGAHTDAGDEHGHTALHYAAAGRRFAVFQHLLRRDPKLTGACCNEHGLLTHVLETGDWRMIEPVLAAQPAGLPWTTETRAWMAEALRSRDGAKAKLLLAKHAAPPAAEGAAQPLLAYAIARNDLESCRFLLECGADPNTALRTLADKSFLDLLPQNVVRGYLENEPGMNVLMLAAGMAQPGCVKLLLDHGANRNTATRSKHKLVPLYFAAWAQSPESIQLLLGTAPSPDSLRIEISLNAQRAALIKNGARILTTDISSGRDGFSTPEGRFVVTDKHQSHVSSIYKVKNAVLHAFELPRLRNARGACSGLSRFTWVHPTAFGHGSPAFQGSADRHPGDNREVIAIDRNSLA